MDACRRGYASDAVALRKDPAKGLLGRENWVRWRELMNMQYWRSSEDLENFAHNPSDPHFEASKDSNQRVGADAGVRFGMRPFWLTQANPNVYTLTCRGWGSLLRPITFRPSGIARLHVLRLGGYSERAVLSPSPAHSGSRVNQQQWSPVNRCVIRLANHISAQENVVFASARKHVAETGFQPARAGEVVP
jgi:hypothetical protein